MKENWQSALELFGIDDAARVLTNGGLHKIKPAEAERYSLAFVRNERAMPSIARLS